MEKIKIIDLLNKIANGEEIENFRIPEREFRENRDDIFECHNGQLRNATCGKWLEVEVGIEDWEEIDFGFLNKEVEIIEEDKKIEKISEDRIDSRYMTPDEIELTKKINEIIDKINGDR